MAGLTRGRLPVHEPGARVGSLVVVVREGTTKFNCALWRCRCDCGRYVLVDAHQLRRAPRRDCGCGLVRPELARAKKQRAHREAHPLQTLAPGETNRRNVTHEQ